METQTAVLGTRETPEETFDERLGSAALRFFWVPVTLFGFFLFAIMTEASVTFFFWLTIYLLVGSLFMLVTSFRWLSSAEVRQVPALFACPLIGLIATVVMSAAVWMT